MLDHNAMQRFKNRLVLQANKYIFMGLYIILIDATNQRVPTVIHNGALHH